MGSVRCIKETALALATLEASPSFLESNHSVNTALASSDIHRN
ncbi:hypothetical protein [Clostridioides difficile]|nr:hypothetical protein [Clostridioides difficile]